MNTLMRTVAMLVALLGVAGCADTATSPPKATVSIMAFNVQNLFDNVDAPGKDDKAYLPLDEKQRPEHVAACNEITVESWRNECLNLDWSDAAVEHKLATLAGAIRQVNGGRGPDIIALQEVENVAILERLRKDYLSESDYGPAILVEGEDLRGIDVAFLSRLPTTGPAILHPLSLPFEYADRAGDVRGLLEATFELPDGSLLTGFSVHFPAPFHPTEMRVLAYDHLNRVRSALPGSRNVFAAGDFNTTSSEDERDKLLDRYARPHWIVSNDLCEGCAGTHYYEGNQTWSFLDMVLYAPADTANLAWQVKNVSIANGFTPQVTRNGTPDRYRSAERTGVSDHWPVVMTLEKRQ